MNAKEKKLKAITSAAALYLNGRATYAATFRELAKLISNDLTLLQTLTHLKESRRLKLAQRGYDPLK